MYDSKRTVAVVVAVLAVVGLAVAPSAAVAAEGDALPTGQVTNDTSTQADHGPFPHEVCTDLLGLLHEQAPYDQLIWVSDLPESAQPPGVPWTVVTPSAIASIVVAIAPDQCEVQDPNDPSWNPTRDGDNVSPDGNADVQPGENGEVLVIVNGTLDNTSEGPSGLAEADLNISENGTLDPNARLNDGRKEYGVDPQLKYWSDGTTYFQTDVYVIGSRLGVVMDCFGGECNPGTRGLPHFVDFPALPAPSNRTRDDGGGDSGGSDGSGGSAGGSNDSGGAGDGGPSADGTGGSGGGSGDSTDGAGSSGGGSGGDGSADGSGGGSDSVGADGSGGDGPGTDGTGGSGGADSSDGGTGGSNDGGSAGGGANQQQQQQSAGDGGNQNAQQAAAADSTGLGILVALVVFILGAAAIAPRD